MATLAEIRIQAAAEVERRRRANGSTVANDLARYRADPVLFVQEILNVPPASITPYQAEILRAFADRRFVCVRAPHGVGKTALMAWAILWFACTTQGDFKGVVTAGVWRQVQNFLFPEIHKWAARADFKRLGLTIERGKHLLELTLALRDNGKIISVVSDNPDAIEGAHADTIAYFCDEAKLIPSATWDAIDGALGSGTAYHLICSTPGVPSGRFYEFQTKRDTYSKYYVRHVTINEAVEAGRVNQSWVDEKLLQWGADSPVYRQKVLGEFADGGDDALIPLSWCEAAVNRWHAVNGKGAGRVAIGIDPAAGGEDFTGIARVVGNTCESLSLTHYENTQAIVAAAFTAAASPTALYAIDSVGVGVGVYDLIKASKPNFTMGINGGAKTDRTAADGTMKFINTRAAMYWMLREMLDPSNPHAIAIPPVKALIEDLTAPTWGINQSGAIVVESKDDIRARIGRSTDAADALGYALWALTGQPKQVHSFASAVAKRP